MAGIALNNAAPRRNRCTTQRGQPSRSIEYAARVATISTISVLTLATITLLRKFAT